jgi:hypothetical protein
MSNLTFGNLNLTQIKNDNNTNNNSINTMNILLNNHTTQISSNTSSINTINTTLNNNSTQITNNTNNITSNTNSISSLNSLVNGHTTQINTLNSNSTTNTNNISSLTILVNGHTTQINQNNADIITINNTLNTITNGTFVTTFTTLTGFTSTPTGLRILYTRVKNNISCTCYFTAVNIGLFTGATGEFKIPINRGSNFVNLYDSIGVGSFNNSPAGIIINSKIGTLDTVSIIVGGISALVGVSNATMNVNFQYTLT